ncbi:hypothetical protein BJ742DRAFT_811806 [Cladochytrium replicatum]|nr:hypothetical protein BJ742DRAFT_811806 [Cladochytrium replicatum]
MGKTVTKEQLLTLFDAADVNGNGKLSLAELDKLLVELDSSIAAHKRVVMRAYKASAGADEYVERDEFAEFVDLLYKYDELYKKFDTIDKNKDHKIEYKEFIKGFGILGIERSGDPEADFKKFDADGHGAILFSEFVDYFFKKTNADKLKH